jgi:hypothetical protein
MSRRMRPLRHVQTVKLLVAVGEAEAGSKILKLMKLQCSLCKAFQLSSILSLSRAFALFVIS